MEYAVHIKITITPYRWKEFVHDVIFVLAVTLLLTNELTKKYLKLSLRQLAKGFLKSIQWAYWVFMIGIWTYLLIGGWFAQR